MAILTDGFPTTLTFSLSDSAALYFEEQSITPPGIDMGGVNDTTNMRNTAWRTRQPKVLRTLSGMSMTCHYDPEFLDAILSMMGQNQQLVLTFPDTSYWTFWGFIDKFTPNEITEGSVPTATVTIEPTNQNTSLVEVAPTHTPAV